MRFEVSLTSRLRQIFFVHIKIILLSAITQDFYFVLLGCDAKRRLKAVTPFSFCPSLAFTIKQQNMFCTLVLRSAAVARGDE
jgi:hypothetical protein